MSRKNKISKVLQKEKEQIKLEKKQLKQLEELEKLEKEIKKQTAPHPLKKITYKDISKASIGALIGTVAHFAFVKGQELAQHITIARATIILLFSFVMGSILIYLTGYRKIKNIKFITILPLRMIVIYFTALFMVIIVLFIFGLTDFSSPTLVYKQIATISILAVLGASSADLIGER